jgi:hypothetical protein
MGRDQCRLNFKYGKKRKDTKMGRAKVQETLGHF